MRWDQDFGVRFAAQRVSPVAQPRAQPGRVLDDAVVDEGDVACRRDLRMGVDPVGSPVSGPAGVGDAAPAGWQSAVERRP